MKRILWVKELGWSGPKSWGLEGLCLVLTMHGSVWWTKYHNWAGHAHVNVMFGIQLSRRGFIQGFFTEVGQSSSPGGNPIGRKPIVSIINNVADTYHESTTEEIRQLIKEWEVDLSRQVGSMEIDAKDWRILVPDHGHT